MRMPVALRDKQGLELSTDNPEIVEVINNFTEQLLGYGNEVLKILSAAESAPDSVLVNIIASENVDPNVNAIAKAQRYLDNARRNVSIANERERAYLEVTEVALESQHLPCSGVETVVGMLEDIVESQAMLRSAKKASMDESHPYHHYLLGILAFAEVECGNVEDAERHGVDGTRRAPEQRDPWAHHAVAHCMEVTGRIDEGIRWMEGHSHLWENCGSFMYTHNWWHTALYYIDRDSKEDVLRIYDERVWGKCKESAQDQLGAASLLWRMDLRDTDVGTRWDEIADYMTPHIKEHIQPFIDLHYVSDDPNKNLRGVRAQKEDSAVCAH